MIFYVSTARYQNEVDEEIKGVDKGMRHMAYVLSCYT